MGAGAVAEWRGGGEEKGGNGREGRVGVWV